MKQRLRRGKLFSPSESWKVVLATIPSDAHTWNLAFLHRYLAERGATVCNLGNCTPVEAVVEAAHRGHCDVVVLSTVNGHGHRGALALHEALRASGCQAPLVAGGRLATSVEREEAVRASLLENGLAGVFVGDDALPNFDLFLRGRGWLTSDVPAGTKPLLGYLSTRDGTVDVRPDHGPSLRRREGRSWA